MRRALLRALVVAVALTVAVGLASPAQAKRKDLNAHLPQNRVVVNQNYEWVKWRLTGPAIQQHRFDTADLYFGSTRTRKEVWDYTNGKTHGRIQFYAWDTQPGRYKLRVEAYDDYFNRLSTKPAYTRVKFGSRVALKAKRHHRKVTLRATARRYTKWNGWKRWKHHTVRFQRKHHRHWKTFRRKRTNKHGVATIHFNRKSRAKYRAVVPSTKSVWARRSHPRRR